MTAPVATTALAELHAGDRFGILGLCGWVPVEFERRQPAADGTELLMFRTPGTRSHPSGFASAFWPGDLVPGENLRPADELAFQTVCPDCMRAAHNSETWLSCARCLGTHLIPLDPWEVAS